MVTPFGDNTVAPRTPPLSLVETLEFPEAVGQELTLRRGLGVLIDGLLARPERAGRPPRGARPLGETRRRRLVAAGGDAPRGRPRIPSGSRLALGPKLTEVPAPVLKLRLEVVELAGSSGEQLELVRAEGEVVRGRLSEGLRQVKAAVGSGGVSMVVEVAPWSRIPGGSRATRSARRLNSQDSRLEWARLEWAEHGCAAAESALSRARGSARRRCPAPGQPPGRRQRARGMADRRPLVDGGAGRSPLLRPRARDRRERRGLPRRRDEVVVHPARLRTVPE